MGFRVILIVLMCSVSSLSAATYYVDPTNGSDSNNGLGPDASHASNKPFKSLSHVLRTNSTAGGDAIICAPGVYRELVQLNTSWVGGIVTLRGDPRNTSVFKTAAGVVVTPDLCIVSAYTNSDQSVPANGNVFDYNGYWNFRAENICIEGNQNLGIPIKVPIVTSGAGRISTNCSWSNVFVRSTMSQALAVEGASNVTQNLTFDNCHFENISANSLVHLTWFANSSGGDWDMNITMRNCLLRGGNGGSAISGIKQNSGNGIVASGFYFTNCTLWGGAVGVTTAASSTNSGIRWNFAGCQIVGGSSGITANDTNQIAVRDCQVMGLTPWSNIHILANVVSNNYSPWHVDSAWQMMGLGRQPHDSLGGNYGIVGVSSNYTSVDMLRLARPATNSFGHMEVWSGPTTSFGFAE